MLMKKSVLSVVTLKKCSSANGAKNHIYFHRASTGKRPSFAQVVNGKTDMLRQTMKNIETEPNQALHPTKNRDAVFVG
jgi:hypothetical protein